MSSPSLVVERAQAAKLRIGILCIGMEANACESLEAIVSDKPGAHVIDNVDSRIVPREVMRMLEPFQYRICVVDFQGDVEEGCRVAERLRDNCDNTVHLFAADSTSDSASIIAAMRSGCTEYLVKPFQMERVEDALSHVEARRHIKDDKVTAGKIIAVMGSKGGTGATSLAAHLALDLVHNHNQKCLIVDQHPALGDVSLQLGLTRNQYSFYELVHNTDRLDSELLQGFLLKHESGLHVLDSPEAIDSFPHAPSEAIEHTLSFLAENYQYVIVDCPSGMTDDTAATIRQSDKLAIVITPELPAIRNALRMSDYLVDMHFPDHCIEIILNRHAKHNALADQEIEAALRRPIAIRIPDSYRDMADSINSGTPINQKRNSNLVMAFAEWGDHLTGQDSIPEEDVKSPRKWFGLFGSGA
jgi:pilus assembly protein CpaE